MAKIEMDLSEYERMMEVKKLLESSLEKERGLQVQVEKLTKEKLQAYEDAKMKVVKTVKHETTEHIIAQRDHYQAWQEMQHIVARSYRGSAMPSHDMIDNLVKSIFTKTKSHSTGEVEITTVGLDEVKKEIRESIESQIDKNTKEKLSKAEELFKSNKSLFDDNCRLTKEVSVMSEKNELLVAQCEELTKMLSDHKERAQKMNSVMELLKQEQSFWTRKAILSSIQAILNK